MGPNTKKRRGCLILVAVIFIIFVAVVVIGIIVGTKSNDATTDNQSSTETNDQPTTDQIATETEDQDGQDAEPVFELDENTHGVGDSGNLGDWGITLDAFEFADRVDGDFGFYVSPDDGCKFALITISVTNNATNAGVFLPTFSMSTDVRAKIIYGDYEYSATNLLAITSDLHDETLNPLVSVSGIIAFNIPESVVDSSDSLVLVLSENKNTLEFALR